MSGRPADSSEHWPAVTVVVPTHGRPGLLPDAVRSVLAQRYAGPLECLVVHDREEPAIPDVTVPAGRALRAIRSDRTPGPSGTRNAGALAAGGELLGFCDDDDRWLPDKARLQVEALRARPECAVATCGIILCNGREVRRVPEHELVTRSYLLGRRRFEAASTSTLLVRRTVMLERIGLLDEDIPASYGEDYEWHLRAAALAPIVAVRQALVRVRWGDSYFGQNWPAIIAGIRYQLERWPDLERHPANVARLYGRLAFAHAASGDRSEARRWAKRAVVTDWRQPRSYLAVLVGYRLLSPGLVVRLAHAVGRGV
jgi:glycosyltransferase involved in cell wall biosynthesis